MTFPTLHHEVPSAPVCGVLCSGALRGVGHRIPGGCGRNRRVNRKIRHVESKNLRVESFDRRVESFDLRVESFDRRVECTGNVSNSRIDTLIAQKDVSNFRTDTLNLRIDVSNLAIDVLIFRNDTSNVSIDTSNVSIDTMNVPIDTSNRRQETSLRALRPRIGKNGFLFFGSKPRNFGKPLRVPRLSPDKGCAQTGHCTAQLCPSKHPDGFREAVG